MFVRQAAAVTTLLGIGPAGAQDFLAGIQAGSGKLEDPKKAAAAMARRPRLFHQPL